MPLTNSFSVGTQSILGLALTSISPKNPEADTSPSSQNQGQEPPFSRKWDYLKPILFFSSLSPSFGGSCEIFSIRGKNVVCIGSPAVFTCRFCCCDRKGLIFSQYKGEWGGGLLVNWSWKCWWRKKTVGATFVCLSDTKCCQKREGCNFIRQPPNTFFASKKPQVTAKLLKKGKGKDGKRRHASFYKIGKWCYVPCLTKCPSSLFLGVRSHCTVVAKAEKTGGGRQKVSPPRINLTQLVTLLSLLFPWGAP